MFREMRRAKQQLSLEESAAVLTRATSGVLAVSGDEDYPYAVPLNFVYQGDCLYFHCAQTGHKLDAIACNDKVSFCVIDQDRIVSKEYTSYFRSVIVFGRARVLKDKTEQRTAIEVLAEKYFPDDAQGRLQEIERQMNRMCMVELRIEHITGKQAMEMM